MLKLLIIESKSEQISQLLHHQMVSSKFFSEKDFSMERIHYIFRHSGQMALLQEMDDQIK